VQEKNPNEYRDELVARIAECSEVVRGLDGNRAWQIVLGDLDRQRKLIDDNWHMLIDDKKIAEARITKFAVMHLFNLKQSYEEDLKNATEQLKALDDEKGTIIKDYDNEPTKESK
jgi:hypothetical protein